LSTKGSDMAACRRFSAVHRHLRCAISVQRNAGWY
jgi:hypothetical protein